MQSKPSSNIFIRNAVMDEAALIASVLYQAFAEFEPLYTPAAFAATAPNSDQIRKRWGEGPVWVMADGSQIIGTVSAVPKPDSVYIRSMAVLPSHRGQKIGYMLLQMVQQFAHLQEVRRMFLSTTPFLTGAIRLYEQFGFHRTDDEPRELFGTPLFTMVMLLETASLARQDGTNFPVENKKVTEDEE
jgi:GNAT superfamily N-acetyltransferase